MDFLGYAFLVLITVIVPVRSSNVRPKCIASILASKYPREKIEILIVAGDSPSAQRNYAVHNAKGDILYFIDDDSVLEPRTIQRIVEAFEDFPQVVGVGGPSVGMKGETLFQKCAVTAMGSLFGLGPARHRYYPSGCPRLGSENELILSNLALRREVWARSGGFDARLYPNEENEFIRRLEAQGHRFLYHPGVLVLRPARESLRALAEQVFRYGKSRARHMRIAASPLNAMLLLPSAFVIYLASLALAITALAFNESPAWPLAIAAVLPLLAYSGLCAAASLYAALSTGSRRARTFLWHLAIFPTLHMGYGAGLLLGGVTGSLGRIGSEAFELRQLKELGAVGITDLT